MNEFYGALISTNASSKIPAEHDLFGQFIGEWDFEWIRGIGTKEERRAIGEWLFSLVLDGTAIQDIFIVPSRKENAINPQPDAEYGTTIRLYNPQSKSWDIFYGARGTAVRLNAVKENKDIILTEVTEQKMKWVFSEITSNSFHWRHIRTNDNGLTWNTHINIFAKRKPAI